MKKVTIITFLNAERKNTFLPKDSAHRKKSLTPEKGIIELSQSSLLIPL